MKKTIATAEFEENTIIIPAANTATGKSFKNLTEVYDFVVKMKQKDFDALAAGEVAQGSSNFGDFLEKMKIARALDALAVAFHAGQTALDAAVNGFLKTGAPVFTLTMASILKADYMALKGANDNAARQMLMAVRKRLEKAGIQVEKSARGGAHNAGKPKTPNATKSEAPAPKASNKADKKGVTAQTLTLAPTDSAAIKQVRGLFAQFGSKWAPDELAALMDDLDVLMSYVEASALNTK